MSQTAHHDDAHGHGDHADGHEGPHAMPISILLAVFGALMFLTFITVAVTYVDLGRLSIWVALIIALVKASLVCLYFMHLRYDAPFHGLIVIISMLFVILFIGITLMDSTNYAPNLHQPIATVMPPVKP
jgi:cytochrome c oxidase subunit 4